MVRSSYVSNNTTTTQQYKIPYTRQPAAACDGMYRVPETALFRPPPGACTPLLPSTISYYGVKKTNKTRLKGWQLVWTHPSKSELQSNSEVKLKGYEVADVELPLTAVCQKVIVPVEYTYCGKQYFRLKKADVKDVLKYKSLD